MSKNVNIFIMPVSKIHPFSNLDESVTIEKLDTLIQDLNKNFVKAIINCCNDDQSLKAYGL